MECSKTETEYPSRLALPDRLTFEHQWPKANSQMPVLDKFREECGVVAIYGHPEASTLAYLGLHALQHRGQESAEVVSSDGMALHIHKSMGLVADIFTEKK